MAHHLEVEEYRGFCGKAEMQKSINSLIGILEGITIDEIVDELEFQELKHWYEINRFLVDRKPFSEILPAIDNALADKILTIEETQDLLWLCQQVTSGSYYDLTTCSIQQLHGIMYGIMSNSKVTDQEISGLMEWLADHSDLQGTYPFDEVFSLIATIIADGIITENERNVLKGFFAEFIDATSSLNLSQVELDRLREHCTVDGICAKDPIVSIPNHAFSFTGKSSVAKRDDIEKLVTQYGGVFVGSPSKKVNYLVVGAEGTPCWAFACYGRKIQKAISLRKEGYPIVILNEHDFWAALEREGHLCIS